MNRRKILQSGAMATALAACQPKTSPSSETDLADMDATSLSGAIRRGDLSAREAVEAAGRRIEALEPSLAAFAALDIDRALDSIDALDKSAPLFGVPYALKDLNNYPDLPFQRGSALFRGAQGDGKTPYTERIDATGLVILGKTQTPEFGLLPTTEPLGLKPSRNPWNLEHSSGGSSGGSAAAVAARMLPAAQSSDGGGSIRIPAACCGVFGMKPTRGRFPEQGNPPRAIDLSIKHTITRSVRDNALILALTELETGGLPPVGFVEPGEVGSLRIALTLNNSAGRAPRPEVARAVEDAASLLESMGHEIVPIEDTPLQTPGAADAFNRLWANGAYGLYQLASQMRGAPPEETGALEPFTIGLAKAYEELGPQNFDAALAILRQLGDAVDGFLQTYDAWLSPVLQAPPAPLGEFRGDAPFEALIGRLLDYVGYTPVHNVAGTPTMSVPFAWTENNLPIGVQIASGQGKEALLFKLAYALEEANPWADKMPALAR